MVLDGETDLRLSTVSDVCPRRSALTSGPVAVRRDGWKTVKNKNKKNGDIKNIQKNDVSARDDSTNVNATLANLS